MHLSATIPYLNYMAVTQESQSKTHREFAVVVIEHWPILFYISKNEILILHDLCLIRDFILWQFQVIDRGFKKICERHIQSITINTKELYKPISSSNIYQIVEVNIHMKVISNKTEEKRESDCFSANFKKNKPKQSQINPAVYKMICHCND